MSINLSNFVGTGITPEQFISGMTRNQDKFLEWYNGFEWPTEEDKTYFEGLRARAATGDIRCLILMADWCGDVVRNVPVVFRTIEAAQIPVDVLILEEHLDLMDEHFLTMGGRSIPIVLLVNAAADLVGQWGPRPTYVQEPMVLFKRNNTDKSAPDYEENLKAARAELMRRYGEGPGYQKDIIRELRSLLR